MGLLQNINDFGGTSVDSVNQVVAPLRSPINSERIQAINTGSNFVSHNFEALTQLADVFSGMTDVGWDDELLAGIERLDGSVPPNARMASLLNGMLNGPLNGINAIIGQIDNFQSVSVQIAQEANMGIGATIANGFSMPYNGASGPTKRLASMEFDIGVQVGMSKAPVLGFWKGRSDNLAGDGYFYSVSVAASAGMGLTVYYDTSMNFQGFVIGPVAGAGIEASVGWSTNAHQIMNFSHGVLHIAGKAADFLRNIGREVSTFVDEVFSGKKMSRDLRSGEGYLSVFNQAGYVTKIELWHKMAGQQKYFSRNTSAGFTTEMYLPRGARDIRLLVTGIATFDKERLDVRYDSVAGVTRAFKAYGTIFDVEFTEISPS